MEKEREKGEKGREAGIDAGRAGTADNLACDGARRAKSEESVKATRQNQDWKEIETREEGKGSESWS